MRVNDAHPFKVDKTGPLAAFPAPKTGTKPTTGLLAGDHQALGTPDATGLTEPVTIASAKGGHP